MSRFIFPALVFGLSLPATAQIATSNEDGATGAYTNEVDSSFTSETRFGPRTAIDDLRADIDRDREQVERLRQRQLNDNSAEPVTVEPLAPGALADSDEDDPETTPDRE